MSEILLEINDVVKQYGRFTAVGGVSLQVSRNVVHSIIGPNGAGKTTLFHTLTGTVPLTSGSIRLKDQEIGRMPEYKRVKLGMARSFQVTSLFPTLTVNENLRVAAQGIQQQKAFQFWSVRWLSGVHDELIESILHQLGLMQYAHRLSSTLSHGQQRRLEVGMALASRPDLILLDEPTSGMGIDDIDSMKEVIRNLSQEHTVLLIEHNMGIVMDISDKVTVMQLGQVLAEGVPAEIKSDERVREAYLGKAGRGDQ